MLIDQNQRTIDYLRLSVTDRCNYRCAYCMPETGVKLLTMADILTFEEITRLVAIMANEGIRSVRLTGGEPLVRLGITDLLAMISQIDGIDDVAMTTNGSLLTKTAGDLKAAGLQRINISIDSVNPAKFHLLTRGGNLGDVWRGYEQAISVGFTDIKINAVIQQDTCDEDYAAVWWQAINDKQLMVRFIEQMPIGYQMMEHEGPADKLINLFESIAAAKAKRLDIRFGKGPAEYFSFAGVKIGFIRALSHSFCANCNRIRLTADGKIRLCLADKREYDARAILRSGATDSEVRAYIREILPYKPCSHKMQDGEAAGQRYMTQIGG